MKSYENIVSNSLQRLKWLVSFYTLKEDENICEILVRSKVNEKIHQLQTKLNN